MKNQTFHSPKPMTLHENAKQSLHNLDAIDPLFNLFKSHQVEPNVLLGLLWKGVVSPHYRDNQGRTLLDAMVASRQFRGDGHTRYKAFFSQPIPLQPEDPWPEVDLENISFETVAGVLIGNGIPPFENHQADFEFDILDVALGQNWDNVVIRCLKDPQCPPARELEKRCSGVILNQSKSRPLPWAHTLAMMGRHEALKAWMSRPDSHVDYLDALGRSPLFYASTPEVVETLLDAGADTTLRAKDGRDAVETWANPSTGTLVPKVSQNIIDEMITRMKRRGHAGEYGFEQWVNLSSKEVDIKHLINQTDFDNIENLRIERRFKKTSISWGLGGFLAWSWLNAKSYSHDRMDMNRHVELLNEMKDRVPPEVWLHESLPGVPDIDLLMFSMESCYGTGGFVKNRMSNFPRTNALQELEYLVPIAVKLLPLLQGDGKRAALRIFKEHVLSILTREKNSDIMPILKSLAQGFEERSVRIAIGSIFIEHGWIKNQLNNRIETALADEPQDRKVWLETLILACKDAASRGNGNISIDTKMEIAGRWVEMGTELPPRSKLNPMMDALMKGAPLFTTKLKSGLLKQEMEKSVDNAPHKSRVRM